MAITSAYETPIEGSAVTSLTDSSVAPSGSDRGILGLFAMVDNTDVDISSFVFNTSENLNVASDGTDDATADGNTHPARTTRVSIWEMEAPSAVDAALVGTATQQLNTGAMIGVLLNGVHQTDMIGEVAVAIGSDSAAQVDITTTEANSLIVVMVMNNNGGVNTAIANTTQKINDAVGTMQYFAGERSEATPGTYTVGTTTVSAVDWACVAVEILNAAAGGAPDSAMPMSTYYHLMGQR